MGNPVQKLQKFVGDAFEKPKNLLGGSGFRADEDLAAERTQKAVSKRGADFSSLLSDIENDETITDVTKQELLKLGRGGGGSGGATVNNINNFDKISSLFNDATTGATPKFRSRQNTQKLYEALIETPGKKQLNFSQRSKSSILGS